MKSVLDFLPPAVKLRFYCEASHEELSLDAYEVQDATNRVEKVDLFSETCLTEYLSYARPLVEAKMGCRVSNHPEERKSELGYRYRWDALTFGKKAFSLAHALRTTQADYLFWVDADIVFFRPVSEQLLIRLFRKGADIVYFGRKNFHSETGFIGFDMNHDACGEFAERYRKQWEEYRIFTNVEGWTDCDAFDSVVAEMSSEGTLKARNLSWTPKGHVMAHSPLAMYFDHLKGERKYDGHSSERVRYGLRRISEPLQFWLWGLGLIG